MATKVQGPYYTPDGKHNLLASLFYYTVSTNNNTTYTLTLSGGDYYVNSMSMMTSLSWNCTITGTGQTKKTASGTFPSGSTVSKGEHIRISNYTWSWTKTHSAQSVEIKCTAYTDSLPRSTATKTFSIPAKPSYTVTYNANGGSGAPSTQTKWYGENLTISSTKPSKSGYTFKGWATSTANANAGTVNYASGATYSGNAALTLYAVYELTYTKPTIKNLTVERCASDGTLDDEGMYAKVSFNWSVYTSNNARYYGGSTYPYSNNAVSSCTVTVGGETETPTLTGTSGTGNVVVGTGVYDINTSYSASVAITDTQTIVSPHATTVTGALPSSAFPIDVNAAGTAVALLRTAPDNDTGVFLGDDLDVTGGAHTSGGLTVDGSASIGSTLSTGGNATIGGSIYLPNDRSVYAKKADGTANRSLIGFSTADNVVIGNSSWSNADGNTNVYGNVVNLFTKKAAGGGGARILYGGSTSTAYEICTQQTITSTDESASTGSINATTDSGDKSITATKTGYYPLGLVGFNMAGTNRMYQNIYECEISSRGSGTVTVKYRFRNNASVAFSGTMHVHVLWIKI